MPAAVEWHRPSWLPKISPSVLDRLQGNGEWGRRWGVAVTLGWVISDVHVKALTRGMWPACTLERGLAGSAALGTGSNAVPESAAHLLALCSCLVPHKNAPSPPPYRPPPPRLHPPSLCWQDGSQHGKNPFTMCAL